MNPEIQKQTLLLIAEGLTSKEIGLKLGRSTRTVEKDKEILMTAYKAENTPHLVAIVLRKKIIK